MAGSRRNWQKRHKEGTKQPLVEGQEAEIERNGK